MSASVGRAVGVVTAIGLFVSTTALGAPRAQSMTSNEAVAVAAPLSTGSTTAPAVVVTAVPTAGVVRSEQPTRVATSPPVTDPTAPVTVPGGPTTTAAEPDPTGDDILAHHATTTVPGDVVVEIVDGSDGLWSSGLQMAAIVPPEALPAPAVPETTDECYLHAKTLPLAGEHVGNLIAQMTHWLFECLAAVEGLDEVEPTSNGRWDGRKEWGFQSLAEQVAAEAVTVAYCESLGFRQSALTRSNPWGYAGLFQIGASEFRRFSGVATSRYEVVDNAYAAARYFLHQYRNRHGWGGWSPWAVVNTNFGGVNDQVKVPILPRFGSTQPGYRGRSGPELPAWAVDPWTYEVPDWHGCPYTGGRWADADRL